MRLGLHGFRIIVRSRQTRLSCETPSHKPRLNMVWDNTIYYIHCTLHICIEKKKYIYIYYIYIYICIWVTAPPPPPPPPTCPCHAVLKIQNLAAAPA